MTTDLKSKFADSTRGLYFIGTTPPKASTPPEQLDEIADKLLARLGHIDFDGLIVYDIQDESSRISAPRPFPYMQTHDPREYSQLLRSKSLHPVITYKSVSQRSAAEFSQWLADAWNQYGVRDLVLVGSPSSDGEIKLPLADAYRTLAGSEFDFQLGGVTIAERHAKKGNEHQRLIEKSAQGCDFFVSQAVYNPQATVDMLTSYARSCREQGIAPKRIILTFTPCGSAKTLEFMEWLGISVPEATRWRILDARDPLSESIRICRNSLDQILDAVSGLDLPLGLNIESLTNRKDEIDASIRLYKLLKATLDLHLAEQSL
ncbi:methylenetetrahydrofolate reductase [Marinobacterium arenosum]|uniref:methylenetetrahydrofolate reductase n=1 Tax=Marinobacterium arenosum TaxID=2862496 RepID=UPI001C98994E|nr:methylenetetrahydrofolate reductase [Marinobacterium arenosum]MBY4675454.1 methylenetetrahydrofolate reductase [Marinobacterium arenosum]